MEIGTYVFVIADISGYTKFIRLNRTSMLHAEQIITDLLESVITASQFPLQISKLEGDAVFLYASINNAEEAGVHDAASQVTRFFDAFQATSAMIREKNKACLCEACATVDKLQLKVVMHTGQAIKKEIQSFKELAGSDVIYIHRMLKNTVIEKEYILASDALMKFAPGFTLWKQRNHSDILDGYGKQQFALFLHEPRTPVSAPSHVTKLSSLINIIPFTVKSLSRRFSESKTFLHLG